MVKQVFSGRGRHPFSRFRTHVRQCPDDRAKTTSRGFSRSDKTPLLGNYPRCTKRPPCSPTAEQPSSSYRPNVGQGSDNPPLRRRRLRPLGQGRIRAMSEPCQSKIRALTALKAHALRTGPDAFFNGCRRVPRATCGRARGCRRQAPRCRQALRAPHRRRRPSSRGTRARCR